MSDYEMLYKTAMKDFAILEREYKALEKQYKSLDNEHRALQHEFSENTIIQSMNDMKEKYNHLLETTVPSYKYELLDERHTELHNKTLACSVLLDYIISSIRKFDNIFVNMGELDVNKIEMQLTILKELLYKTTN